MHQRHAAGKRQQTLIKQAQPDHSGLGQLSSPRLLGRSLLDRGPYHPPPTAALGAANASEQILRLAEAQILQPGGTFGFATRIRSRSGESQVLRLYSIARTVLEWHIKVRGEANPYDPVYTEYFERRRCFAWRTLPRERTGQIVPGGRIRGSGCLR